MKRTPFAAVVAATVAFTPFAARAQAPAANPAMATQAGVAVIDINYIFENNAEFKSRMEALKAKVDGAEGDLKGRMEQIEKQAEQLSSYDVDSAQYQTLEVQLTQQQAQLAAEANLKRKNFMEEEAKVYYEVYKKIEAAVGLYCKSKQVNLVLRFSREKGEQNNRNAMLADINKPVVYHNSLDITDVILNYLNKNSGAAPPVAGQPQYPRTR